MTVCLGMPVSQGDGSILGNDNMLWVDGMLGDDSMLGQYDG